MAKEDAHLDAVGFVTTPAADKNHVLTGATELQQASVSIATLWMPPTWRTECCWVLLIEERKGITNG
jgi:hypothetical protein